ncbi:hypothetical protein AGMMS49940_24710 [Spirochaetia bacterium]|nr:hypothetical protein AGMMS49940_24710 [Spirochaetia bacterium]
MKTTKSKVFLFGMVIAVMAVGFVLAACDTGEYTYTEDGVKTTLTLQAGKKFELKRSVGNNTWTGSGTYEKSKSVITLTFDKVSSGTVANANAQGPNDTKLKYVRVGKKLYSANTSLSKSISDEEVELEFADAEAEAEFDAE